MSGLTRGCRRGALFISLWCLSALLLRPAGAKESSGAGEFLAFEQLMQPTPNLIQVFAGSDSQQGRNASVETDLRLPNEFRLLMGGGSNRSDLDGEELKTQTFRIGFSSDPANEYQGTLLFEDWGVEDELKHQKWAATVAHWGEVINTQGTAAYRQIHLVTSHPSVQGFDVELHSPSLSLSVQANLGMHWNLRLAVEKNWYNVDVAQLQNSRLSQFFSPETLTLSSSFVDRAGSLEVGYQFARLYVGVEGSRSTSAIDDTASRTGSLLLSFDVGRGVAVQLQAGRSTFPDSLESEAVTFGQLGLSYSWAQ